MVERCRQVLEWSQERVLSWVVDRAIFGQEVFEKVLCDEGMHLITWEEGLSAAELAARGRSEWLDGDREGA